MDHSKAYIHYKDPAVEPEVPNEQQLQSDIQSLITKIQQHNFSIHRHGFRGTHVKTQGVLKGRFSILPDLPRELAQGICGPENSGRDHDVAIRFANEPSFLDDDRKPGPRGCGMRVFDVHGSHLDPIGDETKTQDFTFNNAPVLELRDVKTTVEIFSVREKYFMEGEKGKEKIGQIVGKRQDGTLQLAPTKLPNRHFMSYTFYSQSAFRWGDYVCKYAIVPDTILQDKLEKLQMDESKDPEQHSLWLREFFKENDAVFDFKVQLCENIEEQSVEDTGTEWDDKKYPFRVVAKLTFPKGQDSFSHQRRTFWEDRLKLNVWYGLDAHQPLGSVNRLRKELYKVSQRNRADINVQELVDIKSVDDIP